MTRLIFLTFYGNERFPPSRHRARAAAGGGGRRRRRRPWPTARRRRGRRGGRPRADQRSVADRVVRRPGARTPSTPRRPARVARHHDRARSWCSRPSPRSIGFINMPFDGLDFFDQWLEPSFPGVRGARAVVVPAGCDARGAGGDLRARSASRSRYLLYRRGLARPRARPARRAARAAPPRCSGTPTTSTTGSPVSSTARAARSPASSTASSTRRSSTARSTASASWCKAAARGLRHVQDGFVRRYALGHRARRRRAPALRRRVGGAVDGPTSRSCPRSSRCRSSASIIALLVPQRRPEIAKAIGYAATMITFGLAAWLLWHFEPGTADFQFVEHESWITRPRGRLHRRRRRHQHLHDRGHRAAVPARPARVGALHHAPGQGVHRMVPPPRGGDHGHLPLARPDPVLRVLGAHARSHVLPHPRMGERPARRTRPRSSSCTPRPAPRSCSRRRSCSGSSTRPTPACSRSTTACSRTGTASSGTTEVVLFLGFMAAFAIKAPLFPFHTWLPAGAHRGADRGLGGAGRRDPQDGRLRPAALLVRAVPAGVGRPRADLPHARGDRDHLRRDRRRDADRPETRHRVLVGRAHGLRGARHLLAHRHRHRRRGVHDAEPPAHDRRAVPRDRHALRASPHARDQRVPRRLEVGADHDRDVPRSRCSPASGCPGSPASSASSSRSLGTFVVERPFAIVATTGVVLAAVYSLWAFQRVFTGKPQGENAKMRDVTVREVIVVAPLLALSLFLGIYPKPALDRIEPSVRKARRRPRAQDRLPRARPAEDREVARGPTSGRAERGRRPARAAQANRTVGRMIGAVGPIQAPSVDWLAIAPELALGGAAVLVVLLRAILRRRPRGHSRGAARDRARRCSRPAACSIWQWFDVRDHGPITTMAGMVRVDPFGVFLGIVVVIATALALLLVGRATCSARGSKRPSTSR